MFNKNSNIYARVGTYNRSSGESKSLMVGFLLLGHDYYAARDNFNMVHLICFPKT